MKEEILIKIINTVRNLREDGMGVGAVSGSPTNNASSGKIAGLPPDQPPVDLRKKRNWNPFFKDLAKMQRRKPPK
jgi:hypothetical protein